MAKKKNTEDDEVALTEGSVVTKYNVRDAAGKVSFGITEAQKDKIVGAGGTVVNVIRTPGPVTQRPPPEEEPKVILPAPEEPLLPKAELALPGYKPPLEEEPERERVAVEEELELIPPYRERETTRQRVERLAAERAAAEKAAAAEKEIVEEVVEEPPEEVVEPTPEVLERVRVEERLRRIEPEPEAEPEVEPEIIPEPEVVPEPPEEYVIDITEKLRPVTEPTITYKKYTVHYTENGVDKEKTFTSLGAATAFQGRLPKYSISYKGKDYGFQTKEEAEDQIQDIYTSDALNISLKEFQSWSPEKQRILTMQRLKPQPTTKYTVTYMTESGERTVVFDKKSDAERFVADPSKTVGSIIPAWAGGPEASEPTRDFVKELTGDVARFLHEVTESPGTYILNVPQKIADVREDLGEFLQDLTDLSRTFRWKGNMPTRSEVEKYFKDNPDADRRPGAPDSPFRAKTVDEFFYRLAAMTTNVGIGYTKAMTFPISMGLAPTSREYPEELVTQVVTSLLTLSPADVLFTKSIGAAARITGADRVAVRAMSALQRLGIKGQNILNKLLTNQSLTKLEADLWESMAGTMGVSTKQLRDTSGRLFLKVDYDDVGDLAKIVDDALTDMTGVTDWTKVIDKFDDMPVTSPDTQLLVTREIQRQLADMRGALSGLTDIDPGTGLMTRWGIITDAKDVKKLGDAYKKLFSFVEENAASFGAGAATRSTALLAVEEILADVGTDPDIFFKNVDEIINFLANNPASGADLLLFLNQPVSPTHPKAEPTASLLQEMKDTNIIEIKDLLMGADAITVKDIVVDLDPEIVPDIIPDLDKDIIVDVVPKLDEDTIKDVTSKLSIDVIIDVLPKLDKDVQIDIITDLDKDTKIAIIPNLDKDIIIDILPDLDDDTIIDVVPTLDDDTIISIIPLLGDITIERLVPLLEEELEEGRFDYISRNLPMRLRRKFKRAMKKRKPRKLPPSEKPEPYRVMFQYVTGASETKRVDARTFHEALVVAQEQKQIALDPVEVEVEKIVPGTLGSVEIPPLEPLLTKATVGTGVPIGAHVDRSG